MRSIKTTVTAAAVLTAGFVMTAPAAHAAAAPHRSACATAVAAAVSAEHDLNAAIADLKKQWAAGGHPGIAEEQNAENLKAKANTAATAAARACQGMRNPHRNPHGVVHTGVGSTSQGVNTTEIAGGVGILGAVGAGALMLRRRRAGSES
ncbi:hypothetical protein KGQ20_46570 [Catenulispora sp. NF23]|uniref:LPXTG-motif cell wall anchor domain protein n=1 Tax=Catenulispora pinistramenti TaxID=2705254 RepID=A0ABS5L3B8_9ACTN|nr:hypothetical protein [Catenulispora pinistramenti]MBS2540227.1 hypothetical protein [Catenulispora pinistramenti]MBS2552830.1 hypothetical protein [Catenulispora pinistramenti]